MERDETPRASSGMNLETTIHVPRAKWKIVKSAGLFDGEGTLHANKYVLNVSNTHKPTIDWLAREWQGGGITHMRSKNSRRPCYLWWLYRAVDVRTFLIACLPYLTVKRKRAIEMIQRIDPAIRKIADDLNNLPYPDLLYGFEEEFTF